MADFLLEIGLEEIPARMIAGAEAELQKRVIGLLERERLLEAGSKATAYSTPRRLAVLVEGVAAKQADVEEKLTGPSWKVAFKDGQPTPAAEAFAKKAGVAVSALEKVTNAKGEYVGASVVRAGRTAPEVLAAELPVEVLGIYWAKNMYWRAGKSERFVRPIRWLVALLDSEVVPLDIAGIRAGSTSRGHRVLHGAEPVAISAAKDYSETLRSVYVMADVSERRHTIRKALDKATRTISNARWREDEPLVETVVHLTEWPGVLLGNFEADYLKLPEEVLVTVMRDHQKYFAIEGADGKLLPHFLAILNTQVNEDGESLIRIGNERVLRARFKDAQFFWDVDQKVPLAERVESLKSVTFHKELGSYFEKSAQTGGVLHKLHEALQAKGFAGYTYAVLSKTAQLAKTDLTTELVKEFTELQGKIGGQYVRVQGAGAELTADSVEKIAQAVEWQYRPASTEDAIPPTIEGQLFGIADRIQTIVAMFSIGNAPTGSKDPFALRRAANAIVKILAESDLPFTLSDLYLLPISLAEGCSQAALEVQIKGFFAERFNYYLRDVRGFSYDVVNAVLAAGSDDVRDAVARAEALSAARESADFAAISAAFKRIKNILRQAEEKGFAKAGDSSVLSAEARQLADAAASLAPKVAELRQRRAYGEALAAIATLRPAVDAFFDKVMVLDPDEKVRGANLAVIDTVLREFSGIADFSEIVTS